MGIDDRVKSEMKEKTSLTERIALYIPIYRGYKEKNLRREEDRAVRNEVARALQGAKSELASIQRELIDQPDLMMDVERIRTKVDKYDVMIKKSVNGYSGFHDAIKIDESDLDALVAWDAKLVEGIQELRQAISDILDGTALDNDGKRAIRNLERGVDVLIEIYGQRETVMRGFQEEA